MGRKTKQELTEEYKTLTNEEPNPEWTNAELEEAISLAGAGVDVDESKEDIEVYEVTCSCLLVRGEHYENTIPKNLIKDPKLFKENGWIK